TRFSRDWSSDVCSSDLFFDLRVCEKGGDVPTVPVAVEFLPGISSAGLFAVAEKAEIETLGQRLKIGLKLIDKIGATEHLDDGPRSEERRVGKEGRSRRG